MKKVFIRVFYFLNSISLNILNKTIKVHLTARVRPKSILKGFNRISSGCYINGEVGLNTYVGKNSVLYAHIGNYCSIGANVSTIIGNHPTTFVSTSPVFYSKTKQTGHTFVSDDLYDETLKCSVNGKFYGVQIGNDVWIGDNVVIKGGVQIGDGAIISMGSVVVKNVEPFSIVGGVPAKIIRYRFDEKTIQKISQTCWWNWDQEKISKYAEYMIDVEKFLKQQE
jgi:acetyltransferase-like isoleucine patch superfamily enzyme